MRFMAGALGDITVDGGAEGGPSSGSLVGRAALQRTFCNLGAGSRSS